MFFAAVLHQFRREPALAQEHAEAAIAVSLEHGLVLYQAMATLARGWALFNQGRQGEGIAQMREGVAAHRATGTEVLAPHFLAVLAEALGSCGRADEGLRISEEALELSNRKGEGYYKAELCRIRGELLVAMVPGSGPGKAADGNAMVESNHPIFSEAEACLTQAMSIAQQQEARSWELRAATSLARLYRRGDKQKEALDHLRRIYDSFTEGLDTPDLLAARAELD